MDLVATHDSADFDALASLVAASKIYPGATLALTVNVGADVRDFLALHKDRFVTTRILDIDLAAVTRWILVDVRRAGRLRAFGPLLERARRGELDVHVYDHHAAAADDVPASLAVVERVGSATTLLVERIAARGPSIDPVEATLFALGIHVDTGSLTYGGATARDAAALGFLMGCGVKLAVLNRYLRAPLQPRHRDLLRALLGRAEARCFDGDEVALLDASSLQTSDGLDIVASHLLALEGHRALFVWTGLSRGRLHVVGRAREGGVDVGAVLSALGGGGHPAAASAIVRDLDPGALRARLVDLLSALPRRTLCVRDVMTSPAHTVPSSTVLASLRDTLAAWHHTGVPVVDDGRLVGIVSARDLLHLEDRALRHPVASRMRREVVTIGPDEPLEAALSAMTRADVGRLPVVQGGAVIGIVTRSDVRRVLYGEG
jgi:tRNA nucleotidyltransferase (CCA-adding enzyme)